MERWANVSPSRCCPTGILRSIREVGGRVLPPVAGVLPPPCHRDTGRPGTRAGAGVPHHRLCPPDRLRAGRLSGFSTENAVSVGVRGVTRRGTTPVGRAPGAEVLQDAKSRHRDASRDLFALAGPPQAGDFGIGASDGHVQDRCAGARPRPAQYLLQSTPSRRGKALTPNKGVRSEGPSWRVWHGLTK